MADLRISANLPTPIGRPAGDGAKSQALRAAQKAFFDAALNQAAAGAPSPPVISTVPVTPVQPTMRASAAAPEGQPTRLLRPGSLLDIRV